MRVLTHIFSLKKEVKKRFSILLTKTVEYYFLCKNYFAQRGSLHNNFTEYKSTSTNLAQFAHRNTIPEKRLNSKKSHKSCQFTSTFVLLKISEIGFLLFSGRIKREYSPEIHYDSPVGKYLNKDKRTTSM